MLMLLTSPGLICSMQKSVSAFRQFCRNNAYPQVLHWQETASVLWLHRSHFLKGGAPESRLSWESGLPFWSDIIQNTQHWLLPLPEGTPCSPIASLSVLPFLSNQPPAFRFLMGALPLHQPLCISVTSLLLLSVIQVNHKVHYMSKS